jgi:F420-dependent methylenetetrahydromethanopterin dehydrogenase
MHHAENHVRQRQQELLTTAAAHRRAQQARKLARAARRAERAERQLSRSWHTALRLRAELRQLANDPRP